MKCTECGREFTPRPACTEPMHVEKGWRCVVPAVAEGAVCESCQTEAQATLGMS